MLASCRFVQYYTPLLSSGAQGNLAGIAQSVEQLTCNQ
jgi:hypothetical protein